MSPVRAGVLLVSGAGTDNAPAERLPTLGFVLHGEFRDPRLVDVYDVLCPWSRDDEFFLSLLGDPARPGGSRVLDLGCGTGRLTLAMAALGHRVTGVDPAPASLDRARSKPGADRVTWVEGTSALLTATGPDVAAFDIALMTSHVAQFLLDDAEWDGALHDLARALVPGGQLVFDTRDPADRAWEQWNPVDSRQHVTLPDGRGLEHWTETTDVRRTGRGGALVTGTHHYAFDTGQRREADATMRWRTEAELRSSLAEAGFAVESVFGGWAREPVGHGDGEFLVVATSC